MTAGFTPAAASEPGGRECASFTESSGIVPDFPWADACEAKVRTRPLVVIGGGCLYGSTHILWIFPWRASARWYSLAASCRRVA